MAPGNQEKKLGQIQRREKCGSRGWNSKWPELAADPKQNSFQNSKLFKISRSKIISSQKSSHNEVWGVGSLSSRGDTRRKNISGRLLTPGLVWEFSVLQITSMCCFFIPPGSVFGVFFCHIGELYPINQPFPWVWIHHSRPARAPRLCLPLFPLPKKSQGFVADF